MTKRIWSPIAIASLVAACAGPTPTSAVGPTIDVSLDGTNGRWFITDRTGADAKLKLDDDGLAYEFDIEVNWDQGRIDDDGLEYTDVVDVDFTLTVEGETLPEIVLVPASRSFVHMAYRIPAAAGGKTAVIHAQAIDDNDLHSNIIDFTALLDPTPP